MVESGMRCMRGSGGWDEGVVRVRMRLPDGRNS